jgi:hypothetical protein
LAELSQSHGIIIGKYQVTTASDGSSRIGCGSRHLNVCDFLTKEVRLPWKEAAVLLRRSYGRQLDLHPAASPRVPPDRALWQQFQAQRHARGGLRSQLASERARRAAIDRRLEEAKRAAAAQPAGTRKALLSIARMEYVRAQDALRSEHVTLRLPVAEQYRRFLQERAKAGEAAALAELRRRSTGLPLRRDPVMGCILPIYEQAEPNALIYRGRQLRYRVQQNGDVIYSLAGREVIQDKGNSVMLLQTDRVTIEAALRLAQAKFGEQLKLSGSAKFQERAARVAAEAGLTVRFENLHAEQGRQQRAAEVAAQRAAGRQHVGTHKESPLETSKRTNLPLRPALDSPSNLTGEKDLER